MKKHIYTIILAVGMIALITACKNKGTNTAASAGADTTAAASGIIVDKVLTAAEQKALTPDMVIQSLKDGNKRFMSNNLTKRDHSAMVRDAALGQYPKAVILSCLDSRVPVEDIFDKGIGDLFVGRVAGNIVNPDLLGSMEYGCKVSGAKLILVLGHQSCGAVKSAIDNVKLGNITELLSKIKPAIDDSKDFSGEKTSKNKDYVDYVAKKNVEVVIENIKSGSPILKEMADKGEIRIIGAYYDLTTGEVIFL